MGNKQMKCIKGESCLYCGSTYCQLVDERDQLKAENKWWKEEYATAKTMYALCQSDFMKLAKIKNKYKQTLSEIKGLVNKLIDNKGYAETEEDLILQKISEVGNGNN